MTSNLNPDNHKDLLDHIIHVFQIRLLWKDKNSRYIKCNQAFAEDAGLSSPDEIVGKTEFDMPWKNHNSVFHLETDQAIMANGEPMLSFEQELMRSGQRKSWILTSKYPTRNEKGEVDGILVLYQDMTFIKDLEKERLEVNRAYRLLQDTNRIIISALTEQSLYDQICTLIIEHGYTLVWVGKLEPDEQKSIKPIAFAGFSTGYPESIKISWGDNSLGHGPTGTAAREGRTVINQNFLTDETMLPWRERALEYGYQSSIALPLKSENAAVFAVLNIYASEPDAFDDEETAKLEELAQALAFGHEAIQDREQRFAILEKSVSALAAVVESRDPYTAGHQSRVADLAVSIAHEMGLDAETCTGIKLGALIHDIGKMQVPIELLTKPTQLNDIEMALIRLHPEVGYNIVKEIPFPWPVADMVRQHHERIDGSGYPQGLSGEQIEIGARILAVADLIEAMSSHRPYRPAKGIAAAIEELQRQRGEKLDADVVDAALKVLEKTPKA